MHAPIKEWYAFLSSSIVYIHCAVSLLGKIYTHYQMQHLTAPKYQISLAAVHNACMTSVIVSLHVSTYYTLYCM